MTANYPNEWNATRYRQHSSLQEAMAAEVLALLEVRGDERVLDVGCGDGRITAQIADRVVAGSVVGVDASPDMIAHAAGERRFHAYASIYPATMQAGSVGDTADV